MHGSSQFAREIDPSVFKFQHSKAASQLDLASLGGASVSLGAALFLMRPEARLADSAAWTALGLALWSLLEYGLHRYVLHGLRPFSTWHAEHHRRPAARIYSPTYVGVALIGGLVYLPMSLLVGAWPACALAFGVLSGYFAYSVTHHAVHHHSAVDRWLGRRRHWHVLHHAQPRDPMARPGYYGVTSAFWDHVFRSDRGQRGSRGFRSAVANET